MSEFNDTPSSTNTSKAKITSHTTKKNKVRRIGSIHDINYLVVALSTFESPQEAKNSDDLVRETTRAINEWASNKALKYNLSRPRLVREKASKEIITELRGLGLLEKVLSSYRLADKGYELLKLAREGKTESVRDRLIVLMLITYHQITDLLESIYLMSPSGEIVIPRLSMSVIRPYLGRGEEFANLCLDAIRHFANISTTSTLMTNTLHEILRSNVTISQNSVSSAQLAIDKYLLSSVFGNLTSNRRSLDVIISRCISLELVNTASIVYNSIPCHLVYLTASISPPMLQPPYIKGGYELLLPLKGRVQMNRVELNDQGMKTFEMAVKNAFLRNKLDFGQARIAEVREDVCHELRLSDRQFNILMMETFQREPGKISLNYSFEKIMSKSRPIIMDEEGTAIYNLMKINY